MKRLLIACLGLSAAFSCHAADAPAAPKLEVHSLAREFVTFWDGTQGLPEAERVQAFKTQVGAKFPEFYGVERYAGARTAAQHDDIIRRNIAAFGEQRQAYLDKVDQFGTELPGHIATFTAAFPDFKPVVATYFLHSLGEMDGGTRVLNGRNYLIFGADGMVRYHGKGTEAPFFHHELFHTYHYKQAPDCDDSVLWQRLWIEGLATYVSKVLNPQANDQELLIDFPKGSAARIRGQIYANMAQLERVFDSPDEVQLGSLFYMNGASVDGLPPRRGYMLGYLVAEELGKTRSPAQLANLSCTEARPLITAAIHTLKQQSSSPSF
ncbi:hypothetical protein ASC94_19950 [Massilia sp. Root418]|uniref:hypothetical protein n=1 Tax=Massilia sp. Root418 TaxID=1736532 RepID=UPI0006F914E1|nr:hypothetical protein [Massilia sp. Root418]KQW90025.1 hypothetical protein ASC94_19950 [Massilia sp. Root418]